MATRAVTEAAREEVVSGREDVAAAREDADVTSDEAKVVGATVDSTWMSRSSASRGKFPANKRGDDGRGDCRRVPGPSRRANKEGGSDAR